MRNPGRTGSFVVNGILAGGVLFYVLRLSASGRTAIDYLVIGLVVSALAYNLVQLSRRLYRTGGTRAVWHVQRTALFWVIGIFNTLLLRPEHVDNWRHWAGWTMLGLAAIDTVTLFMKERASVAAAGSPPHDGDPSAS